jgi:hypothetical protein
MKRILFIMLALMLATALAAAPVLSADYQSGDKIVTTGPNTLAWTGQGAHDGVLDTVQCTNEDNGLEDNTPYLLWVFETDGGSAEATPGSTPELTLGGSGTGTYDYFWANPGGSTFHFVTPYFTPDSSLTAVVTFSTITTGGGQNGGVHNLLISHGCPGDGGEESAVLTVVKFYDANANGIKDPSEPFLSDWPFTIDGGLEWMPFYDDEFPVGTYSLEELTPNETNWVASNAYGVGTGAWNKISNTQVEVTLVEDDDLTVYFGNYCLRPSGGLTLGFWSNKNGQKQVGDDDLAMLRDLNLVNGGPFNPNSYAPFRTWLLAATATNMAYMLSAQLAAMELNVLNGAVDGGAFYIPYGGTIYALMTEANVELGVHPTAYSGDTWRAHQEFLKNCLDALNNGAKVIPTVPCPYTFTLPVV